MWSCGLLESVESSGDNGLGPSWWHTIEHLLWTLMFLKTYAKQKVLCALAGAVRDETFQKWTWDFIHAIVQLEDSIISKRSTKGGLLSTVTLKSELPRCCHRSFGKTD
jgi:hypothetical protein